MQRGRGLLALGRLFLYFCLLCAVLVGIAFQLRHMRYAVATSVPPASVPQLGITVELEQYPAAQQATMLANLHEAGFQWVRQHVDWAALEPARGAYAWQSLDSRLHAQSQTPLLPVLVLENSPTWARSPDTRSWDGPTPPQHAADFAAFAGRVAQRTAAALPNAPARYYQIWHEPNLASHWGNQHVNPVRYAQLVRAAAAAIRAADPRAVILSAALAPTNDRGHLAKDEISYLQRFLAAGGGRAVDAFGLQAFGFGAPPSPTPRLPARLSFDRVLTVRHALARAGYGDTPIWITQFGWNREPNATWGAVSPATQLAYSGEAVAWARTWPWLAALGWAMDQPAPASSPLSALHGFALTPSLSQTLVAAQQDITPPPQAASFASRAGIWLGLGALLLLSVQRSYAAARVFATLCTSQNWRLGHSLARRVPQPLLTGAGWAVLGVVYYLAVWPPLILLCWLVLGWAVWRAPQRGIYLAALLLPFYFYHKTVNLVDIQLNVAPSHLFTFTLIPPLLHHFWQERRGNGFRGGGWHVAGAWLGASILAGGVAGLLTGGPNAGLLMDAGLTGAPIRHLGAFFHDLLGLTVIPLFLAVSIAAFCNTAQQRQRAIGFLAMGGVLAAGLGLYQWANGVGVIADETLRLRGPYFSPNQMALYAVRTLMLLPGIALSVTWTPRTWRTGMAWAAGSLLTGVALLLTASRGGLLLGVPAGLLVLAVWGWRAGRMGHGTGLGKRHLFILAGLGLVALLAISLFIANNVDRLLNAASVVERLEIWRAALTLWRAHFWTGVGPGGFFWTFPAYIPPDIAIDPNTNHPHNVWLEILTTWGVLGGLWVGVLGIWVWHKIRTTVHTGTNAIPDWRTAGLLAGLVAGLAHGQVDAFFMLPDVAAWNALALALILRIPPTAK